MGCARKFPGKPLIMSADKSLTKKSLRATSQRLNHCLCGVTFPAGDWGALVGNAAGNQSPLLGTQARLMEPPQNASLCFPLAGSAHLSALLSTKPWLQSAGIKPSRAQAALAADCPRITLTPARLQCVHVVSDALLAHRTCSHQEKAAAGKCCSPWKPVPPDIRWKCWGFWVFNTMSVPSWFIVQKRNWLSALVKHQSVSAVVGANASSSVLSWDF